TWAAVTPVGATMGVVQGVPTKDAAPVVKRRVQLAATPIGPPLPQMLQSYHTSVIIDDMEFSFSGRGIDQLRGTQSHIPFSGKPEVTDLGYTKLPRGPFGCSKPAWRHLHPDSQPASGTRARFENPSEHLAHATWKDKAECRRGGLTAYGLRSGGGLRRGGGE
ncbi:unnamed protein product, partial [Prorocentrum cordatum]